MFVAQREWIMKDFPHHDPDWIMGFVKFGEKFGEPCLALLEGKEGMQQRTYLGFGQGWVLSRETFPDLFRQTEDSALSHLEPEHPVSVQPISALQPDPLIHLRAFQKVNFPGKALESGIIGYLDYEWGLHWQKPKSSTVQPHYFFRLCPINIVVLPLVSKVILEVFSIEEGTLQDVFSSWSSALDRFLTTESDMSLDESYESYESYEPDAPDIPDTHQPAGTHVLPESQLLRCQNSAHSDNSQVFPQWQPNMSRQAFLEKVAELKELINAGDIFQAVLSQRFTLNLQLDPWAIYQALRVLNPSPWLFCVAGESETLVGSSPELLISSLGSRIQTRPIAGTRPRGANREEDLARAAELLEDPKEMAEHAMLVDLGRNDIGQVSEYGSVKVTEYAGIQSFSHVMHIVSTVEGKLATANDSLDALRAVFPAGTLSGAPKVRAMEILQDTEPTRRGAYGGALGILRWSGDLDFCITIRTLSVKEDEVSVQAGAGIVYDSVPEREYEETLHKARALFKVIESLQN